VASGRQSRAGVSSRRTSGAGVNPEDAPWSPSNDATDMDLTAVTNIQLQYQHHPNENDDDDMAVDMEEVTTASIRMPRRSASGWEVSADPFTANSSPDSPFDKGLPRENYYGNDEEQTMEMTEVINAFSAYGAESEQSSQSVGEAPASQDGATNYEMYMHAGVQGEKYYDEGMEMAPVTASANLPAIQQYQVQSQGTVSDDKAQSTIQASPRRKSLFPLGGSCNQNDELVGDSQNDVPHKPINVSVDPSLFEPQMTGLYRTSLPAQPAVAPVEQIAEQPPSSDEDDAVVLKKQRLDLSPAPPKASPLLGEAAIRNLHEKTDEFIRSLEACPTPGGRFNDVTIDFDMTNDFGADNTEVVRQLLHSPEVIRASETVPDSPKTEECPANNSDADEVTLSAVQPPVDLHMISCSPMIARTVNVVGQDAMQASSLQRNFALSRNIADMRPSLSNVIERTNAMRESTRRESMAVAAKLSNIGGENISRSKVSRWISFAQCLRANFSLVCSIPLFFFFPQSFIFPQTSSVLATPSGAPLMTPRRPQMPPPKSLKLAAALQPPPSVSRMPPPSATKLPKPQAPSMRESLAPSSMPPSCDPFDPAPPAPAAPAVPQLVKQFLSNVNVRFLDLVTGNTRRETMAIVREPGTYFGGSPFIYVFLLLFFCCYSWSRLSLNFCKLFSL
jgi:hypothetical protein